ncbi:MAG: FG-GAP-like repeat-containing protein [Acidobacteriota bacterium]
MTPATFQHPGSESTGRRPPGVVPRRFNIFGVFFVLGFWCLAATAASAQPTATTAIDLDAEHLIGESLGFDLTFDNAGGGNEVGYGPFIDLVFPTDGADGAGGLDIQDGLSFLGATYLGSPLSAHQSSFPDSGDGTGCVTHSLLRQPDGDPAQVCGGAGDVLVTLTLPFGSFVPDQPTLSIAVQAQIHAFADLGVPLTVRRRGGYRFGADPLDNPVDDPPVLEVADALSDQWPAASTLPQVATLRQVYLGPEDETATGPNFPRRYRVLLNVADGQSLSDVRMTEHLAEPLAFLQVVSAAPAYSVAQTPAIGVASQSPANQVQVDFASVTGDAGDDDAVALVEFFGPRVDALGAPVLDPTTGAPRAVDSQPSAVGTWQPLDPPAPATPDNVVITGVDAVHTLILRSVAIQKSHTDLDGEPLGAGDALRYALDIQVSDYFAIDELDLVDIFSDGQRFTADSVSLDFDRHGAAGSGAVAASDYSVAVSTSPAAPPHDGTTTITLDLSAALDGIGLAGPVYGGCVPSTAPAAADCSAFNAGGSQGTLFFDTEVQQDYSDTYPSGDSSVDEGDRIDNDVDIDGSVLGLADFLATGHRPADDSRSQDRLPFGTIATSIYAVNGAVAGGPVQEIFPGDAVTYRIRHTLPTANFENFEVTGFLPLPVYDATELSQFQDNRSADAPPAGVVWFGPAGDFRERAGFLPIFSIDADANAAVFDYGTYDDALDTTAEIDLLLTVTVTDRPMADELLLTEHASASQSTTQLEVDARQAIVQSRLRQPVLVELSTGVVATTAPDVLYSPNPVGPTSFIVPGGDVDAWAGTVTAPQLLAAPVDSDLDGVDAGDLVVFATSVQNTGGADAYDLTLRGDLPAGLVIPAGGPRLAIRRGDGQALGTTAADAADFFTAGLELIDAGGGAALAGETDDGSDLLMLTYVLQLADGVAPSDAIDHRVELLTYAGLDGSSDGANHIDITGPIEDDARVTVDGPDVSITITATTAGHTADFDPNRPIAVGEKVRLRAVVRLPEGVSPDATWLPSFTGAGFVLESIDAISADPDLSTDVAGGFEGVRVAANQHPSFLVGFGDVTNADRDDASDDELIIDFAARAVGVSGQSSPARGTWTWDTGQLQADTAALAVVEPTLELEVTSQATPADGGDVVSYTAVLSHAGSTDTDAFDLLFSEDLSDPGLGLDPGAVTVTVPAGATFQVLQGNGGGEEHVQVTVSGLPVGDTATVEFDVRVIDTVAPGIALETRSELTWESLPGVDAGERAYGPLEAVHQLTTAPVTVEKAVVATSDPVTGAAEFDAAVTDLTPGEVVTYEITVTVPEGEASSLTVLDQLPVAPGLLELMSVEGPFLSATTNLSFSVGTPQPVLEDLLPLGNPDGYLDAASWFFGAVTNPPDGAVTEDDRFTVRVIALLKDIPANAAGGDDVINAASVSYGGSLLAAASAPIEIVEPELRLTQTPTPLQGEAGDIIDFVALVRHKNASTQTAFDLELIDGLDPGDFVYAPDVGALRVESAGTGCPAATAVDDSDPVSGLRVTWPSLERGQICRVLFSARLAQTVQLGTTVTKDADLNWDNRDLNAAVAPTSGEQRDGNNGAAPVVAITGLSLTKDVFTTSLSTTGTAEHHASLDDLTIGERVTYRLTLTLPDGVITDAIFEDALPRTDAVLAFEAYRLITAGTDLTMANEPAAATSWQVEDTAPTDGFDDLVRLTLGQVTNLIDADDDPADPNDQLVLEIDARVIDVAANVGAGDSADEAVRNTATVSYNGDSYAAVADIDVVEPELSLQKTLTETFVDAFDTVDVELTLRHTADSTADAFNLVVLDTLPSSDATFVSMLSNNCPGAVDATVDPAGADVSFELVNPLPLGVSCSVYYRFEIGPDVEPSRTYDAPATLRWDSTAAGEDLEPVNNRRGAAGALASWTVIAPTVVKVTTTSDFAPTGSGYHDPAQLDLTIGEEVCFELEAFFPEGLTPNAILEDLLPTGGDGGALGLTSAALLDTGANLSFTGDGSVTGTDEIGGDGVLDTVRITLGDVRNSGADNLLSTDDRVLAQVCARAIDAPANVDGQVVTNAGRLRYSGVGLVSDDAAADIVEPQITVTKSFLDLDQDVATVQLELRNVGTAPAFEIELLDSLDDTLWSSAGLVFDTTAAGFTAEARADAGGDTVAYASVDPATGSLAPGESAAFVFSAPLTAQAFADPQSRVLNTAMNSLASTLPGTPAIERELADVEATAELPFPHLEATLAKSLQVDADGSGSLTPGDTVRHTIVWTNTGLAPATDITVTHFPDPLTLIIDDSFTSVGVPERLHGPEGWRIRFSSIAAGDSVTASYSAVLSPMPLDVFEIVSQASATYTERTQAGLSDDPSTGDVDDPTRLPVTALPDLAVAITAPSSTAPGDSIVTQLAWDHRGQRSSRGAHLTVDIPDGLTVDPGSSDAGWACAATECTVNLGNLDPSDAGAATLAWTVDATPDVGLDEFVFNATIGDDGSQGADADPSNNTDSTAVDLDRPGDAEPSLTKTLNTASTAAIGDPVEVQLVVRIPEASRVRSAELADTVPGQLTVVSIGDLTADPTLTLAPPPAAAQNGDELRWVLGDIVNPDTDPDTAETLVVTLETRLANVAENQNGVDLPLPATLEWVDAGLDEASVSVDVAEPELAVDTRFDRAMAVEGSTIRAEVTIHHTAASTATAYGAIAEETLPAGLLYDGDLQVTSGPTPTVAVDGQDLDFTWPQLDLSHVEATPVAFSFRLRVEATGRFDRRIDLDWTSRDGVQAGERTGDPTGVGGALNDYSAFAQTQLNHSRVYGFEDLKNDPDDVNDFDYNDWVIGVSLEETTNEAGEWTHVRLEIEALARGAGFNHLPYLDLGLEGQVQVTQRRYFEDTLLETVTSAHDGEMVRDLLLFPNTYTALPRWLGQPFDFAANSSPTQTSDLRTVGQRVVIEVDVLEPELNPAVADDGATQHLNETFNHLLGPWIHVINTGQEIRHRWRGSSATQDIVTAELYGPSTPLLGYPLDQSVAFNGAWRWPVERVPTWDGYPSYVKFVSSGGTFEKSWFETGVTGSVWPADEAMPTGASGSETGEPNLPSSSFRFSHDFAGPVASTAAVTDLDGDGQLDVLAGAFSGEVVAFRHDGTRRGVWGSGASTTAQSSPTVVDLDGDGRPETVRGDNSGRINIFDDLGQTVASFDLGASVKSSVAAADLAGDGGLELVLLDGLGRLHVLEPDGTALPGFPLSLGGDPDYSNAFSLLPSPSLADLQGDDRPEIVVATNTGDVYAVSAGGAVLPGWPVALGETVLSTAAVADLDGLAGPEILITDDAGGVHALGADGSRLWTARRGLGGPSSPAIGDLDGDGSPEIVTGSMDGKVYAFDAAGDPVAGWPFVTASQVQSTPAVVDLDGDGHDEVIVGSFDRHLYVLSGSAKVYFDADYPVSLGAIFFSSPVVADLDGDRFPEIIVGNHDRGLYALEVEGRVTSGAVLWSQFGGDAENSGRGSEWVPPVVADTSAPTVAIFADGTPIQSCRTLDSPASTLELVFSEPVNADVAGVAVRLLSAGADETFDTVDCSPASGDDRWLDAGTAWAGVQDRVTLAVDAPRRARLEVRFCRSLRDLAGNLLDGDADGFAGGSADRRFRVDTGNRFANGHFDCSLDGWGATAPAAVALADDDALGAPDSHAARFQDIASRGEWLDQCVPVSGSGLTLEASARSVGANVELLTGCVYFEGGACDGAMLGSRDRAVVLDAGAWTEGAVTFAPVSSATSALCYAGFRTGGTDAPSATLDRLRLTEGLFADGFESGDLSAWAGVIGGSP